MRKADARVNVQDATLGDTVPATEQITEWAIRALERGPDGTEVTVRIVGADEGQRLNQRWREGSEATNVLAFPLEGQEVVPGLIGDVVVCAPVANFEANRDDKDYNAHWAHLVIHGTLHLLGYDHQNESDASKMEALEHTILHELGYPDPYL